MALDGSLDAVEPFQVRGWVRDPGHPQDALTVSILLHGETVGSVRADLYRADLEQAGVGTGHHAFIYNFDRKLDPADVQQVFVRAAKKDGSFEDLYHHPVPQAATPVTTPEAELSFNGETSDNAQYPVFILGAARSGTSAVTQALLKLDRFKGYEEGHLLDVLAYLSVALGNFEAQKSVERTRHTAVSRVSREYIEASLDEMAIRIIREIFPEGRWVEKTPNANMIHLAPRFRKIWPNSRFIFMKRRFLENEVSRSVKFPIYNFSRNCHEWNVAMTAWLEVRNQLQGAAIELDQRFLKLNPDAAAEALKDLLSLTEDERRHLAQGFRYDHPERTSDNSCADLDILRLGWRMEQTEEFERQCSRAMEAFGYSTDSTYYRPGYEMNGLVWV